MLVSTLTGERACFYFDRSPENIYAFFFEFSWEFCIEELGGFLVKFFWSPFPTKRSTKTPRKIVQNSEQNSGRKFEKLGELSFCNFSDHKELEKRVAGSGCESPPYRVFGGPTGPFQPDLRLQAGQLRALPDFDPIFYFACSPDKFCEYFFVFAWEFCIEKWRGFLVNFFWSPFPTNEA